MKRLIVLLLAGLFSTPLIIGILGSLLPALSLAPSLAPGNGFAELISDPRFWPSLLLTIKTGIIASLLVFGLTLLTLISAHGTRVWRWLFALMPPVLAVPHAAIAVGLIFLISPSGWLSRLVSPGISGWQRPPTDWVVPDAGGWSLIAGLLIKEAPFLLLAAAAQLPALNIDAALRIGRTLGYAPARCWSRLILPRLYPRIRLTLLIILAFNLSVVDMAVLLGPGNPPTFAVFLLSLVNSPGSRAAASAGALILAGLVIVAFIAVLLLEKSIASIAAKRRESGKRGRAFALWRSGVVLVIQLVSVVSTLSMIVLLIWSLTKRWRFPNALPSSWTLDHWVGRASLFTQPLLTTLSFAVFTVVFALIAAIVWLELERNSRGPKFDWLWYVPLLIPQITLLFGWQAAALMLSIDGWWLTVAFSHWVYALPYVVLILAVSWRELDPNWSHAASVLGAGYWRTLFSIRLPLLIKPLSQGAAVAVAVSVAQYLPTLLLGAGRHQTLATELVTSFGGVDRRVIATLAAWQSLLPLLAFIAALIIPRYISRARGTL